MAIPVQALVRGANQQEDMKLAILRRHRELKVHWKPLTLRQNAWEAMYFLLDAVQQAKPLGVARRFVSNEPRTGVDAALSILTRNPTKWRIPLLGAEDENQESRRQTGRIERTLEGLVYTMDELFIDRINHDTLWRAATFQGLLRGMIWGKFHITTEALLYRRAPLVAEIYDAYQVFPHTDQWGLNHVIIEKDTNLGDLVTSYPGIYDDLLESSAYNPNTPAVKLEFWSNDRGERKGMMAVLGSVSTTSAAGMAIVDTLSKDARWLVPPFLHGYAYDELPVVGVAVNGAHISHKAPLFSPLADRLQERADLQAMGAMAWHGPNSQVAETGRSILSSVEETVPQYNEIVATLFQHLSMNTYDTLVFKTPTGELPEFERGIGASIALNPQESVESLRPQPMSTDAYRLLELLQDERQKGVLSNVLQAVAPNMASGVLLQQIEHAALGSLEPYQQGLRNFGTRMGTTLLAQMQKAAPILGAFELQSGAPSKTFFNIEFNPLTELDQGRHYRPVPVIKPALPDDLTVRMTAARMALDPRRPMLSLMTVMEDILNIDDPMAESDRIWEDLAQQDPVIMLEQMAMALEKHGEMEMAARIRQQEFAQKFVEEQKIQQITGGGQRPGFDTPGPEAGPLSLSTQRTGTENPQPPGAEGLGVMGTRTTV